MVVAVVSLAVMMRSMKAVQHKTGSKEKSLWGLLVGTGDSPQAFLAASVTRCGWTEMGQDDPPLPGS